MDPTALFNVVAASPWIYPLLTGMTAADAVLPVIPSEAAVLGAGTFAHTGTPNMFLVIACAAVGFFVGDHLAYALSRNVLGPRMIGKSARLTRAMTAASGHLTRHGTLVIIASRFVPGGRTTVNAACGATRLPLSRFTPASAMAALAWATYMVGLGYFSGAAFVAHPVLGLLAGIALSFVLGLIIERTCKRVTAWWTARNRRTPLTEPTDTATPCEATATGPAHTPVPRLATVTEPARTATPRLTTLTAPDRHDPAELAAAA